MSGKSDLYLAAINRAGQLTINDLRNLGIKKSSFEATKGRLEELREQGLITEVYQKGQTYYRLTDEGRAQAIAT